VKLLLDTHIWLWSVLEQNRIKPSLAAILDDPEHEHWLSPISVWELGNLLRRKRLSLDSEFERWVPETLRRFPFRHAPLTHEVALQSHQVDLPHNDPADRILAATAVVYDLTLVTADERLLKSRRFPVLANR